MADSKGVKIVLFKRVMQLRSYLKCKIKDSPMLIIKKLNKSQC
jgi:hypothetical protein